MAWVCLTVPLVMAVLVFLIPEAPGWLVRKVVQNSYLKVTILETTHAHADVTHAGCEKDFLQEARIMEFLGSVRTSR